MAHDEDLAVARTRRRSAVARRGTGRLAPLVLALLIAGCGGGSGTEKADGRFEPASKGDAAEMEHVMRTFDGKEACQKLMTPAFVRAVFGTRAACERQVGDSDREDRSTELVGAETDGDDGRAQVTVDLDGGRARGTVLFTHTSGHWQVKDFGGDFFRSLLSGGLGAGIDQAFGGLADDDVRGCVSGSVKELPDAKLRELGYAAFRRDKAAIAPLQVLLFECLGASPTGRESLRKAFEQGIKESADADDKSGRLATCVLARLRKTLRSQTIAEAMIKRTKDGSQVGPEITAPIADAQRRCLQRHVRGARAAG